MNQNRRAVFEGFAGAGDEVEIPLDRLQNSGDVAFRDSRNPLGDGRDAWQILGLDEPEVSDSTEEVRADLSLALVPAAELANSPDSGVGARATLRRRLREARQRSSKNHLE